MFKLLRQANARSTANNNPNNELVSNWLRLNNVPNIGYIRLAASAAKLNCSILELLSKAPCELRSIGWSSEQIAAMSKEHKTVATQVKQTIEWLETGDKNYFVSLDCEKYPPRLKQISRPPLFLFVNGNIDLLSQSQIAFVGSRKASLSAIQITNELIQGLATHTNCASISGLALGIDAACHSASLANNIPTIGVLGCGVDIVYPKRHKQLYAQVASKGALVSEFLLGSKPVATMFPRRNRIISGMSLGTVVVEAKIKSGSLVSAKYALEQNREVFAVPSNINNPNAQGCHWLIKQGAKLTESIEDIIDEIPCIRKKTQKVEKKARLSLASDPLLDSVSYHPTSVDLIAMRTGLPLNDVLSQLLEYELLGLVASTAEGYVKLRG
jgi:DNA processing protein